MNHRTNRAAGRRAVLDLVGNCVEVAGRIASLVGLLLGIWAVGPLSAESVHSRAGTSSAAFLKIPVGARPVAMGEAFTAVADDVNALFWNPAGLAGMERPVIGATHQESYDGINHEFFGYAQPLYLRQGGKKVRAHHGMTWGAGVILLSVPGDLERRSGAGEGGIALGQITTPEGSFGATDFAANGSFAWRHNRDAYGVSLKYIRQVIDADSGHTAALDLGWKRDEFLIPDLAVGAMLQNLGPGIAFSKTWFPLPMTLRTGASYTLKRARTILAMDASFPRDDFPIFGFGGETAVRDFLFFRAGYRYRWHGNQLGFLSGWRTGVGVVYRRFTLDYAVAPFGELGNSHRFSLGYRFGGPPLDGFIARKPAAPAPAPWEKALEDSSGPEAQAARKPAPAQKPVAAEESRRSVEPTPLSASAPATPPEARGVEPELAPAPKETPSDGLEFVPFNVKAVPKIVSARGSDFQVTALAPFGGAVLRSVAFRIILPSERGLDVSVARGPARELPEGFKTGEVFWLKLNIEPVMRAVRFKMSGSEGDEIFGLFGWQWRRLATKTVQSETGACLEASGNVFPQAVAVGTKK